MMSTDCFLRFSWKSRAETIESAAARIKRFLTDIKKIYPTCAFVRYSEDGSSAEVKPNAKQQIKAMILDGIATGDASGRPIPEIGYTVIVIADTDSIQLPFHISCGSTSEYAENVVSCSFPAGGKGQYRFPLPETEFMAVCRSLIQCWSPTIGLFSYHDLVKAVKVDDADIEVGIATYLDAQTSRALEAPSEFQTIRTEMGQLIWLPEAILSLGKPAVIRALKKLVKLLETNRS